MNMEKIGLSIKNQKHATNNKPKKAEQFQKRIHIF